MATSTKRQVAAVHIECRFRSSRFNAGAVIRASVLVVNRMGSLSAMVAIPVALEMVIDRLRAPRSRVLVHSAAGLAGRTVRSRICAAFIRSPPMAKAGSSSVWISKP